MKDHVEVAKMDLKIEKIKVAPNPRGKVDAGKIKELVESIKQHGVLQPIVCCTSANDPDNVTLVAGSRRLAAAKLAGHSFIPAIIRVDLTEDEILDIQLEENLQREDLDPIDEGRYLAEYRKKHGNCTIDELAKRIGKSPKHITQRIALIERLLPSFQKMVKSGTLSIGRAQVLAALSAADQEELNPCKKDIEEWEREEMDEAIMRGSTEQFHEKVTEALHRIAAAPWKKAREVRGRGGESLPSCDDCMNRSDRQGYLIPVGTYTKDARCLNSSCWGSHLTAWLDSISAKLKEDGRRILTEKEVANVVNSYDRGKDKFVDLGPMDGTELPYEVRGDKFNSKCRVCGNLGYYVILGGRDRKIKMACLDRVCFKKPCAMVASSKSSDRSDLYDDIDLKSSAQIFATASWAMAKAREINSPAGVDLGAMAAALLVLSEHVYINSKERYALQWILEAGGCEKARGLSSFAKLLTNPGLDVTARALAYFMAVGRNMFDGKVGEIAGDLSKIMPKARKLFSPSNKHFLKSLLRSSVQNIGRHYKVKGIGGRRDDAIRAVEMAKIESVAPMPKVIEECFVVRKKRSNK